MYDNNLALQASTTQTASFNSASLSLRQPASTTGTNLGGTPKNGPLKARVAVSAISGAPSVVFKVQHSDDNATWFDLASQIDAPFSASTGLTFINFETDKPYIRLVETMTGGTTPSITYRGDLGIARP